MGMVIYKIVNKVNEKIYIGQTTKGILKRLHSHSRSDMIIGKAIRKYGIQSFDISVIDVAEDKQTLNEKEKYWIRKLNSLSPHGYNISIGGTGGNLGELVNKKIGDTQRGRKRSKETIEKMRGQKRSKETIEKMRHPHKKPKPGHMMGKTVRTEEYRKNIGLSSKGRKNPKLAEFNRSRTGQKQSEETQEKKRKSLKEFYENKKNLILNKEKL
jgi:group I intron endonuclease